MATRRKASAKPSAKRPRSAESISDSVHEHASHLIDEAERAADSVVGQVRELFDGLADRISTMAKSARESQQLKDVMQEAPRALDHVREAGEASVRAISEGFDVVRRSIIERAAERPRAKRKGKKIAKKKAKKKASAKESGRKKKPAGKKKKVAKKTRAASKVAKKKTAR